MNDDLQLPSSLLEMSDDNYYGAHSKTFNNVTLKIGLIKSVIEIDNPRNINKKSPEYDVLAFEQDGDKGISPITYRNCQALDEIGGIANFSEQKLTAPTDNPDMKEANTDDGSYVLIMCVDGSNTKATILGATQHHNRKTTLTKANGMRSEKEFNGIRTSINDDGELTITFKGKTDKKGVPKTKTGGSQFKIEKDGSVELNTRDLDGDLKAGNSVDAKEDTSKAPADYDMVRVDKTKQSVTTKSRKNTDMIVGADLTQTVTGNHTMTMKDLLVTASGKATYGVTGAFDIKADGEFSLKAANGKFTFDDALKIMASTMDVNAQKINLGAGATPALMIGTQFIGIGNLGIPVISTAIGPFSATVGIAP